MIFKIKLFLLWIFMKYNHDHDINTNHNRYDIDPYNRTLSLIWAHFLFGWLFFNPWDFLLFLAVANCNPSETMAVLRFMLIGCASNMKFGHFAFFALKICQRCYCASIYTYFRPIKIRYFPAMKSWKLAPIYMALEMICPFVPVNILLFWRHRFKSRKASV